MHALTASRRLFSSTLILGLILGVLIISAAPALASTAEGFEGVTPPAFPAGWSVSQDWDCGSSHMWTTSGTTAGLIPPSGNQAAHVGAGCPGYEYLVTPAFPITSADTFLTFNHRFDLPAFGDNGNRLEISIPSVTGDTFWPVASAGGSFQQGGYNSPYGWRGSSDGIVTTIVKLPSTAAGQNVSFRFNRHTDYTTGAGWMIDDVQVAPLNQVLTVTKDGSGTGTVTSDLGLIDCGLVCTHEYVDGTPVTLTAAPDGNSDFAGWTGPCENENANGTCQVTMEQAKTVTATFTVKRHTLDVAKDGNGSGTVTAAGIDCGTDCDENFDHGTAIELSASPDSSSVFAGWMGPCENENANGTCQVTMGQATSVTATFTLKRYELDVAKDGNGSGTVTAAGIDCGTDCDENFDHGTAVTLTPDPDASSEFAGWTGPCESDNANGTCQMTMGQAKSVTATFTLKRYALDVSKDGNGSGTVTGTGINCGADCDETFDHGTPVTLTPDPDASSEFAGWTGPCESDNADGTCQMTIGQATSATATFTLKRYPLSVSVEGPGGVVGPGIDCSPDCDAMFDHGTQVRLRLETVPGAYTVTWGGACEGSQGSCTVTMTEARDVTATFSPIEEEPEPTVLRFQMLLTLDLDGDQLVGTIGTDGVTDPAPAEADACTAGRWVKLMKETPGFDRTVAGKWTADDGSFGFDAAHRAGNFYVKVKRKVLDVGNTTIVCRAGRSLVERVS